MTHLGKTAAINRLYKALEEGRGLTDSNLDAGEFKKWRRNTKIAIDKIFGDANHGREFGGIIPAAVDIDSSQPRRSGLDRPGKADAEGSTSTAAGIRFHPRLVGAKDAYLHAYTHGMRTAYALLEAMIEEIQEHWDDEQSQSSDAQGDDRPALSHKVFVVHGRDEGVKQQAARTLEKLGLEPIILHEQPNLGKTIVEKFEDAAESAGFAVVLLTGDDEGRLRGDGDAPKLRARQNVIFELGYLSAKLGRRRVCALVEDGVETPSDYDGVVYVPLDDNGAWQWRLAKELRAAEYDVDANGLI